VELNTDGVAWLVSAGRLTTLADSTPVDWRRRWGNDDPLPAESSSAAGSVSLLAVRTVRESVALGSPGVAVSSVVEWRTDVFLDPGPGNALSSAFLAPNSAVLVTTLSWANLDISLADSSSVADIPSNSESLAMHGSSLAITSGVSDFQALSLGNKTLSSFTGHPFSQARAMRNDDHPSKSESSAVSLSCDAESVVSSSALQFESSAELSVIDRDRSFNLDDSDPGPAESSRRTLSTPLSAGLVLSLTSAHSLVLLAGSLVVERRRSDDGDPLPAESSSAASSVSLLTDLVVWSSSALLLPASAESSVIERRADVNLDPVPAEVSTAASGVPVSAVGVSLLFWANRLISDAGSTLPVERWRLDDVDPVPTEPSLRA